MWVFRAKKEGRQLETLLPQGIAFSAKVLSSSGGDTYATVATFSLIRIVLKLAARLDMEIHHINIKGTYLNRELTDEELVPAARLRVNSAYKASVLPV